MICLAHHMNSSLFTSQCHRPTMISKAHHSPPSLDLWSLARARRGGGSRAPRGAGEGLYTFLGSTKFSTTASRNTTATQFSANTVRTMSGKMANISVA